MAEIEDIIDRFARSAVKAREAGFDFVELRACHGHNLVHQFFSPLDNRRQDIYGGSLEGRMRFGLEVARAIRAAVEEDYPFFWRMSAEEFLPGGYTLDESIRFAAELKKAGVDVINVSVGHEAAYEAAPVAAQRGHKVTLFEGSDQLGGQLIAASVAPHKQPIKDYIRYKAGQLRRTGVEVKLGKKVTSQFVEQGMPDVVIVATGARPLTPDIPGVESKKVVNAIDVLLMRKQVGDRVVILGGELVACETALVLAAKGKKVYITRREPKMAAGISDTKRLPLLYELGEKGVVMLTGVKYGEINEEGLVITNKQGKKVTIAVDNVVLAVGAVPNDEIARELEGRVPALYNIGDCVKPWRIMDVIHKGAQIGRQIQAIS